MLVKKARTFPVEVDFIENRQFDFPTHGAGELRTFDSARQKYVPSASAQATLVNYQSRQKSYPEIEQANALLRSAIDDLKKARGDKDGVISSFDPFDEHSWGDVLIVAKDAQSTYLKTDSGNTVKIFRKVQDSAQSIKPFVDLLPDGSYKPLCGGLKLILTVMMKNSEMREKLANLLDTLPLKLQNCQDYAKLYPGENSLRMRTRELYIRIIQAITLMVQWYTQSSIKRAVHSFRKNEGYLKDINDRIDDIRSAQEAFNQETNKYHQLQTKAVAIVTCQVSDDVTVIGRKLWNMGDDLQDVKVGVNKVADATNGLKDVLKDMTKTASWLENVERMREELRQKQESEKSLAAENERLRKQLSKQAIRPRRLMHQLRIHLPDDAKADDFDESATTTRLSEQRAKQIVEDVSFRNWFNSDKSSLLCVNGNQEVIGSEYPATSYLASLLIENLERKEILVLKFSCSNHPHGSQIGKREIPGSLTLLRALLAQMLQLAVTDQEGCLHFLDQESVEAMEENSCREYLEVCVLLIEELLQYHAGIVLIIDGLDYYDLKWPKETKRLIKRLSKMTDARSSRKGPLKVLLMAQTHCNIFPQVRHLTLLDMPEELDNYTSDFEVLEDLNDEVGTGPAS